VAFLDDDDEWKPEKIQRQVETFQSTSDRVGFVYTGTEYHYDGYTRTVANTNRGDVTKAILAGASFAQFSAVMVRQSIIEERAPRRGVPQLARSRVVSPTVTAL